MYKLKCAYTSTSFPIFTKNYYWQPYIYVVFSTGWHFLPNIVPRAGLINTLKNERDDMKESLLDLKCLSIKYNLVFTGLRETPHENTEEKLVFSQDNKSNTGQNSVVSTVFGQRKLENENIRGEKVSDPQSNFCSLYLPQWPMSQ